MSISQKKYRENVARFLFITAIKNNWYYGQAPVSENLIDAKCLNLYMIFQTWYNSLSSSSKVLLETGQSSDRLLMI